MEAVRLGLRIKDEKGYGPFIPLVPNVFISNKNL
jgi:hypothetical protein